MNRVAYCVRALACVLGLIAWSGCGSSPTLVPVEGKATVGGQPLTLGDVTFFPTETGGANHNIVGKIGPDGTYTMTTDGKAGVPKGKYKVTVNTVSAAIVPAAPDPSKPPQKPQRQANANYEKQDKTDLTIEVPSASYDLKLSPP